MGKWRNGQEDKSKGWQYWPGSWSSPGRQAPWRDPKAAGPAGILAYDAQKASSSQGAPLDGVPAVGDGEVTMVQELQKAVNNARKMESKVKRIHLEQAERKAQWQNWEQDLKRTYVKERARFQAALNRLDGELQEALRAQEQARSALRQVANGQQAMEDVGAAEGEAEFEELIGADPWEDFSRDAVLQRALAAAAEAPMFPVPKASGVASLTTPTRGTGARPMTPVLGARHTSRSVQPPTGSLSSRMVPFPPPVQGQIASAPGTAAVSGATLLTDPYVVNSPADQLGIVGSLVQVGGTPSPGQPKTPKARQPIKDGARPSGPVHQVRAFPGIQEKINEKRAALMQQVFINDDDTGQAATEAAVQQVEGESMD